MIGRHVQNQEEESDEGLLSWWPVRAETLARFAVGYLVLVTCGLGIGWLVTEPLATTAFGDLDTNLSIWLETHRTPFWDSLSNVGSSFANTFNVIAAIIVLVVGFAWFWKRWRESLTLGFGMALEALVFLTVSLTLGRGRPPVEQLDMSPPTASFPSGHTGAAVTFYVTLALIVFWNTRRAVPRILAVVGAVAIPTSVGVARLYRGMHYLSDVAVGAGLGLACLLITVPIVDRAIRQKQLAGGS